MFLALALYRKKFSYFYHTLRNCSYLIIQDKTLLLLGGKESSWAEYKRKYGFIGIGARRAVIAGHIVVIRRNVLHCSGGAVFSFTCNPSINHGSGRSAFTHTEHTQAHPHNPSHAPSKKKKRNAAKNHPSGLQNSIRGKTELKCIKTHNMCHPSAITSRATSCVSAEELHNESVPLLLWAQGSQTGL